MPAGRPRADIPLLFAARTLRLFAYGFLAVVLALYLEAIGLGAPAIGLLFTLTLAGDAGVSLWLTTRADRLGRRRVLLAGAALMVAAGAVFLGTRDPVLLVAAAVLGVISPSGYEIGPFLSVEQAALSHLVPDARRTHVFAWYNLAGSLATAAGALCGGVLSHRLQHAGLSPLDSYRAVLAVYAAFGILLAALFWRLSPAVEVEPAHRGDAVPRRLGLHRSRGTVFRLSALFALDAFAGGFILQSIIALWFHRRFGADEAQLGGILFGANLLAAVSSLLAVRIAARIGLVRTMVFTHLPSNLLLCLVPLMPTLPLAVGMLLVRYSISQMDVPTRQSYTMAVVAPDERAAASGVTTIARSLGASLSPVLGGFLLAGAGAAPFLLAGGLKVVYDVLLFRAFSALRPPEERRAAAP
jgi:MFS family permease